MEAYWEISNKRDRNMSIIKYLFTIFYGAMIISTIGLLATFFIGSDNIIYFAISFCITGVACLGIIFGSCFVKL